MEYPYLFICTAPRYVLADLIRHVHALGCLWTVLSPLLTEHQEVSNLRAPTEGGGTAFASVGVVFHPLNRINDVTQ